MKGSKKVETVVQSISSLTHSYTIMAGITMEFKLLPLYILFKEHTKNGDWPPTLKEQIIRNMVIFFIEIDSVGWRRQRGQEFHPLMILTKNVKILQNFLIFLVFHKNFENFQTKRLCLFFVFGTIYVFWGNFFKTERFICWSKMF